MTIFLKTLFFPIFLFIELSAAEYWRIRATAGYFTSSTLNLNLIDGSIERGTDTGTAKYFFPISYKGCHRFWVNSIGGQSSWGIEYASDGTVVEWIQSEGWGKAPFELYFYADVANITLYALSPSAVAKEVYLGPCFSHPSRNTFYLSLFFLNTSVFKKTYTPSLTKPI